MLSAVNVIPVKFLFNGYAPLMLMFNGYFPAEAAIVQFKLDPSKPTPQIRSTWDLQFPAAELAKSILVMFVARVLGKDTETPDGLKRHFYWAIGATVVVCGIIFLRDISTSALIFGSQS
jgi:cell division protein FtsW